VGTGKAAEVFLDVVGLERGEVVVRFAEAVWAITLFPRAAVT
jgi:hypothetical protein